MTKEGKVTYAKDYLCFDIETSSFTGKDGRKLANVYSWAVSIGNESRGLIRKAQVWRDQDEWLRFMNSVAKHNESNGKITLCFVHNLSYEWQFIRHLFDWDPDTVFAIGSAREVVKARTRNGIEFRCSMKLSGLSLAKSAERFGLKKMVGDLDHELQRHTGTPLTEKELGYIRADVDIMPGIITGLMGENDCDLSTLPLTATGFVRKHVNSELNKSTVRRDYYNKFSREYNSAVHHMRDMAIQGGYVHACNWHGGDIYEDVVAYDLASSYPAVMCDGMYPTTQFLNVSHMEGGDELLERFTTPGACYYATVKFNDIMSTMPFTIWSRSKCHEGSLENPMFDNGRVLSADSMVATITNVDYLNLRDFYMWDSVEVLELFVAKASPLPMEFTSLVLESYGKKTRFKNVEGKDLDYRFAKTIVNSIYGMTATNPIHEPMHFDSDLVSLVPDEFNEEMHDEAIEKASKWSYSPHWGVWVAANGRRSLLSAIKRLTDEELDVLYCDTDSMYIVSDPRIDGIMSDLNDARRDRMHSTMVEAGYDGDMVEDLVAPRAATGERVQLGAWEFDGHYDRFKTLGAKRYAGENESGLHITVAGLTKKAADVIGCIDNFNFGMHIGPDHSGRMISTYDDKPFEEDVVDYLGNPATVSGNASIHLERGSFSMKDGGDYSDFLEENHTDSYTTYRFG